MEISLPKESLEELLALLDPLREGENYLEIPLQATSEGLSIRKIDASRTLMVDLQVSHSAFSKYNLAKRTVICPHFNVSALQQVLGSLNPRDEITLAGKKSAFVLSSKTRYGTFNYGCPKHHGKIVAKPDFSFDINLLIDRQPILPVFQLPGTLAKVKADESNLEVSTYSKNKKNCTTARVPLEHIEHYSLANLPAEAIYNSKTLSSVLNSLTADQIYLSFSNQYPLRIASTTLEGKAQATYFMVPKIR